MPRTDSQPTLATGAIAFAPSDPRIIYVGTGEAGFGNWQKAGLGILKSMDGGQTWTLLSDRIFAGGSIAWIRVDPSNPNLVLAATARGFTGRNDIPSGYGPTSLQFGIYRSMDGGTTWVKTLSGEATALEVDPRNFQNQYAAIGNPFRPQLDPYLPTVDNGLYRSIDGGQTWAGIEGPWKAMAITTGYIALAVAPSQPGTVYASIQEPTRSDYGPGVQPLLGLFRTDNAWDSRPNWKRISTESTSADAYTGYCDQCGYAHVISVDPSDPETLFAGGRTLWRCLKCGDSPAWTSVQNNADHHSLVWTGNRLIDGNDHGLFSSTDRGANWTNQNSMINAVQFFGGALHPSNPNFILAGTQDNLAVKWTGGSSWERISRAIGGFCEGEVEISSKRPDTDWMCVHTWAKINRTTDGLQSWTPADSGIDHTGATFPTPVKKCPNNDDVFVAGTNRMWRTNNFFSAVTPAWAANGPIVTGTGLASVSITAIAFAESDASCKTYAYGTPGGALRLTRDGGNTWTDLDPKKILPPRLISALSFDPTDPNALYAGFSGFDVLTPSKPGHVFKTANAFDPAPAWVNISAPVDMPVDTMAVDPSDTKSVFLGTDSGLWHTSDGGSAWQRMGSETGMPNVPVYDIKINRATKRAVAFTYGRGAYMLSGFGFEAPAATAISSVAHGATYIEGGLVPGSWAQVKGTNVSSVTRIWNDSDFAGLGNQLPTKLSGVEVKVNNVSAAVYYVSPTQISFQVPSGIFSGPAGAILVSSPVTVVVYRDGIATNALTTTGTSSSPGIFPIIVNGKNYPAGVFLDGKITGDPANGAAFRKARPGEVIQLYVTGLIRTTGGILTNFQTYAGVSVKIGDVVFPADAAVLVAPGEFQVNFRVPQQFANLPDGDYPISIQVKLDDGATTSSPATINSDPQGPLVIAIQH